MELFNSYHFYVNVNVNVMHAKFDFYVNPLRLSLNLSKEQRLNFAATIVIIFLSVLHAHEINVQ